MNKKTKLAQILDNLTLLSLIFVCLYLLFNCFIKLKIISLVVSIFLSILIFTTFLKYINIHKARKNLTKQDESKLNSCVLALRFGEPSKIRKFWLTALNKKYTTINHKHYIKILDNNTTINFIYDFSTDEITLPHLLTLKEKSTSNKTVILAQAYTQDCYTFAKNDSSIQLLDASATYILLKDLNTFPQIKEEQIPKRTFKNRFLSSINRKSTLKFLRYGILLFIFSMVIPFANYYKFFAYFLFLLSIISFFRPIKELQPQTNILFN